MSPPLEALHHIAAEDRDVLLNVAERAIESRLGTNMFPEPDFLGFPARLQELGASFVTLRLQGRLRGCVGTLQPRHSLAADVWHNGINSAFYDIRFPPLSIEEFERLSIGVSVLGPAEAIHAESEAEVIRQLRPGVHGVILRRGSHVATFLPTVWSMVQDAHQFLRQLRAKAGLPVNDWPDEMCVERYKVQSFQLDREHVSQMS